MGRSACELQTSSPDEPYYIKDGLKFLYNYNALVNICATGNYHGFDYYKKYPGFVYAFASPDASDQPPYRTVPRGWARTDYSNNFGFRGPDIIPRKSGRVVRVAFLAASVAADGWPSAFRNMSCIICDNGLAQIDSMLISIWSTRRAPASTSTYFVQIMRYEVAPLHPDIVISYDGGEYLRAGVDRKRRRWQKRLLETQRVGRCQYHPLMQYSAFLSRLYQLSGIRKRQETLKPAHTLNFDLTQQDVDLDREDLPFSLHEQIAAIRDAANTTRSVGGEFFLTSYVGMVGDRIRLDPVRHKGLLDVLNDRYFPMTYHEIRQSLDFENAAYRKLAQTEHYSFIDIDRYFPQDPDLFGDELHLLQPIAYA